MDSDEMVQLSEEFAALAAELHVEGANQAALQRMVELAVKHIPGCSWASVTIMTTTRSTTLAASDDVARTADRLQYELHEGPCLSAAQDDKTYAMFDVATDRRWPLYSAALAADTPVHSVLAFQLAALESAALNLFADRPQAFDHESFMTGAIFAAHVSSTVALYEAENRADNLEVALEHSREIGAAIGVLMAHHKITRDEAFELLRTSSQQLNRKLRTIAEQVVQTGALPTCHRTPAPQTGDR